MIAKKLTALLLSALTLFSVSACTQQTDSAQTNSIPVTGNVTLTSFNVGKADALVLQTANTVTVIDTGNKGDGKKIDKFLEKQGIDTVDTLIITHFDQDHVGGAARVINKLKVKQVYVPDYEKQSEEYDAFIEKVQETGTPMTAMPAKDKIEWQADDAAFALYAPEQDYYGKDEENDFSLVLYVQHGENKLLFAGDAENARMKEIIGLHLGNVDFLKFPYHGNYLSTTEDFLDACKPKVSIVCCSAKENADPSTVETLQNRGVETYYMYNGDVTIVSDGKTLSCSQTAKE
ncbi:MAG: MBL fold metallo-hydrolase [Oscillospiraceae bacterium]|nr:MBL fold metallo-hydrolase [Oscillospiraceae bacterium]MBQ5339131.1 MBL fold metallo-hydrolase [Oscillospiraceae bacterium]